MKPFHVHIYACASSAHQASTKGHSGPTLNRRPEPPGAPFDLTFEQAEENLAGLPRMCVEPDGSFVWVSTGPPGWQLDGNLYDRRERLWYVEVQGTCTEESFDRFLSALGWPSTQLLFQLTREALTLDETEFRRRTGFID